MSIHLLAACQSKRDPKATTAESTLTLGLLTGLNGTTEPCGCTSNPLGGLDRLATAVETLQRQGHFALLVNGNTFYDPNNASAARRPYEENKGRAVAQILQKLTPVAVVPGPHDMQAFPTQVMHHKSHNRLPIFASASTNKQHGRELDSTLITRQGIKLGIIGYVVEDPLEALDPERITLTANALRRMGAEFVIAMLPSSSGRSLRAMVEAVDRVDVIVAAGTSESPPEPTVIGETLLVEASDQGQRLGLLHLHRQATGPWVYNNEGRQAKNSLEVRLQRLRDEVAQMPEGQARAARADKIKALETQQQQMHPETPSSSYVTWQVLDIDRKLKPTPWAKRILVDYNRSLCTLADKSVDTRPCEQPVDDKQRYIGTATCASCHPAAMTMYQTTKHSIAWATLEHEGKQCDVGCIGCHSVGFEKPSGYCRPANVGLFKNVGCENCHGPGSGHMRAPSQKDTPGFIAKPSEHLCVTCHNQTHSDQFNFTTYLPRVLGPGHGAPARSP